LKNPSLASANPATEIICVQFWIEGPSEMKPFLVSSFLSIRLIRGSTL
jgi:hypothetical protein